MPATVNKYLNLIDLSQLDNWSVQTLLDSTVNYSNNFELARIGDFLIKNRTTIEVEDDKEYRRVTVKINNNGVLLRDVEKGINIGTKKQYLAKAGQFIVSRIDARNGAFGIIPEELDGAIVTNDFPLFDVNQEKINPQFLLLITSTKEFIKFAQSCSSGTTNRQRMDIDMFLNQKVPLPTLLEQSVLLTNYDKKFRYSEELRQNVNNLESEIEGYLFQELGILKFLQESKTNVGLQLVNFNLVSEWGIDKILKKSDISSNKFPITSFEESPQLVIELFRGKSPKYKESNSFILNQKCNRWNDIDLSHVKTVDEDWLKSVNSNNFTREGDILINSTGEGTIGRASYIRKEFEGLLYDSHLLLLRVDRTKINPELFVELFNSEYGQNQVDDIKSAQATKQTELGVSNLTRINFPLPESLALQESIISNIIALRRGKAKNIMDSDRLKLEARQDFEKTIFN